jgi:perosamine synthetase
VCLPELVAAVGALDIEPGDEVIVSPWTMAASATAIIHWNCIPVFADIEPETFCLDVNSVEANISPYTKAIMAVDIFGQSADMKALRALAEKHNLKLISDTAQAPGALYQGSFAGTLSDIGGYSLNYHKHIHTGEGGILVTNDSALAERMQLIRNHAETVVGPKGVTQLNNMIGHNFRLGEIEAAMGIEQLKKLPRLVKSRQVAAEQLSEALADIPGIKVPTIRPGSTHVYYIFPLVLDLSQFRVSRDEIHRALIAEGVQGLNQGYTNLHLLPMYQRKIAYGTKGFPWTSDISHREVSYAKGICPVAEDLHEQSFLGFEMCRFAMNDDDVSLLTQAFSKVLKNFGK